MQSLRQYRQIRQTVAAQVQTGRVNNLSTEKRNVLDDASSSDTTLTTTDLKHDDDQNTPGGEPIIVGWDGPEDALNPRNWSLTRRAVIFAILWVNV